MSEGAGHVRGAGARPEDGAHPGWSWDVITCRHLWGGSPGRGGSEDDAWLGSGHVRISMGAMDGATSWLLRSSARMRMSVVTARQRWAGRQFFWCGVAHTRPPGHVRYKSGPKKKMLSCKPGCLILGPLTYGTIAAIHLLWDASWPPSTRLRSRYVPPSPLTHTLTVPRPLCSPTCQAAIHPLWDTSRPPS